MSIETTKTRAMKSISRLALLTLTLVSIPVFAAANDAPSFGISFDSSGGGKMMSSASGNVASFGQFVLGYGLYAVMAIAVLLAAYFFFVKKELNTALYFLGGLVFVAAIKVLINTLWT